jgi:small subunit ribosomal protein S20
MPNTKSAIKNVRKNITNHVRNQARRSRLKTLSKKASAAILQGDTAATKVAVQDYISASDTTAKLGVIHKNAAGRLKSKYSKYVFA